MVTERQVECAELLVVLKGRDWTRVLEAIDNAALHIQRASNGDVTGERLAMTLAGLSEHEKWEIRRAVAQVAGQVLNPVFESALVRLVSDDNARVRQAAQQAVLRRRDWRNASALGTEHDERINATLDDVQARFGVVGREAVKRTSEEIANIFARELYHEVIKLISPLVTAADRLRAEASSETASSAALIQEADRIGRQVAHLRAVLNAMRAYAAVPHLEFASESLGEMVEEAAQVAGAWKPDVPGPAIQVDIPASCVADVVRSRLVQALTNILINAIESYEGLTEIRGPICIRAEETDGVVRVSVRDAGCGMSSEVMQDARTLFSTSKRDGTGVGLPLAIKIVESEHGGRVNLESNKGVGTIATITIPSHRSAHA